MGKECRERVAGGRAIKRSLIMVWAESSACLVPASRRWDQERAAVIWGCKGLLMDGDRVVVWGRLFSVETWEGQTNEEVSREHAKHMGFPSPSKKKNQELKKPS